MGKGHKDVRFVGKVPKKEIKNHKNLISFKYGKKGQIASACARKSRRKKKKLIRFFKILSLVLDKFCSKNIVLKVKVKCLIFKV